MSDVINLRTVRKQKARVEKDQRSAESRALHGRTRAQRDLETARAASLRNTLDAHRRERQGDE